MRAYVNGEPGDGVQMQIRASTMSNYAPAWRIRLRRRAARAAMRLLIGSALTAFPYAAFRLILYHFVPNWPTSVTVGLSDSLLLFNAVVSPLLHSFRTNGPF